jgi:DNA-binding NarL/FixJ family response regulator
MVLRAKGHGVWASAVSQGQIYLSPQIAHVVVDGYVRQIGSAHPVGADVLTGREREVLQLLAEGKSTKVIAAELVRYAIREGLTNLDVG